MVYKLPGWGMVGGAYHKMQDTDCSWASAKLHLKMELVHRLTNIPRFSEVGGIQCQNNFDSPLDPPLVNKDKSQIVVINSVMTALLKYYP